MILSYKSQDSQKSLRYDNVINTSLKKIRQTSLTVFLEDENAKRIEIVGGKAASLTKLSAISGIKVPQAFVLTTSFYNQILQQNPEIKEAILELDKLSCKWLKAKLAAKPVAQLWEQQASSRGKILRGMMGDVKIIKYAEKEIVNAYNKLCRAAGEKDMAVAVRSSCTLEDRADSSFAGQYDTYLHKKGKEEVLTSIKECLVSQFTERVINYRNEGRLKIAEQALRGQDSGIDKAIIISEELSHTQAKLAVIVQRMVDAASAGVGFSVDSKSGAPFTHIDINYGLGESVVSGSVSPDSYDIDPKTGAIVGRNLGGKEIKISYVRGGTKEVKVPKRERQKFVLTDSQAKELARKIATIRRVYRREVDTEFAIDSKGKIYFLQARPETVASKNDSMIIKMRRKIISEAVAKNAEVIFKGGVTGSPGASNGIVMVAHTIGEAKRSIKKYKDKQIILVADRTDPDWVPIMKKVSGIVTRVGGATCHAAIVSRELEVPCIVGTGKTTSFFKNYISKGITLDANNKTIYKGKLLLEEIGEDIDVRELLKRPTKTAIGLNISNPDMTRKMHALAGLGNNFGISLLRIEFLLEEIGVHVNALVDFDKGKLSSNLHKRIAEKIVGFSSGKEYFITKLAEGISSIAAVFPNSDIALRTTDFKTNEYKSLIGGEKYESEEANPMMGWRGLVRSLSPENREAFKWELEAIKRAREMGYKNIKLMFPVVRDPKELTGDPELTAIGFKGAYEIMEEVGLSRGKDDFKVGIMVEVPTNAIRIHDFIDAGLDFISFGTNDLTQFTLAADRDNEKIQGLSWYGETNPAVVALVKFVIKECKERGIEIGICGQAPSNNPEFARMLVREEIDSIGVTPDRFLATYRLTKQAENLILSQKFKKKSKPRTHDLTVRVLENFSSRLFINPDLIGVNPRSNEQDIVVRGK